MQSGTSWDLRSVVFYPISATFLILFWLFWLAIILVPFGKLLKRTGHRAAWCLVFIIPFINLIALWVLHSNTGRQTHPTHKGSPVAPVVVTQALVSTLNVMNRKDYTAPVVGHTYLRLAAAALLAGSFTPFPQTLRSATLHTVQTHPNRLESLSPVSNFRPTIIYRTNYALN